MSGSRSKGDAGVLRKKLFSQIKVSDRNCKAHRHRGSQRPPMEASPGTIALFQKKSTPLGGLELGLCS